MHIYPIAMTLTKSKYKTIQNRAKSNKIPIQNKTTHLSNTTNICFAGSVSYKESSKLIEMLTPSYIEDNILIQNEEGKTLVHTPYFMIANKAAEMSPRKFRQTVLMKDNNGKTPLHYNSAKVAKIFAEKLPREFMQAIHICDNKGLAPYEYSYNTKDMLQIMTKIQ